MARILPEAVQLNEETPASGYIMLLTRLIKWDIPKYSKRNEYIDRFSWPPHWQAEVTTALVGLDRKISVAYEYGGLDDAYGVWDDANKYHEEAQITFDILSKQGDQLETSDPYAIRNDAQMLEAMAEYLLAVNSLDVYKWKPRRNKGKPNRRRQQEINQVSRDILVFKDNDLMSLWNIARYAAAGRANFWARQLDDAEKTPIVQEIREAIRTAELVSEEEVQAYLDEYYGNLEEAA